MLSLLSNCTCTCPDARTRRSLYSTGGPYVCKLRSTFPTRVLFFSAAWAVQPSGLPGSLRLPSTDGGMSQFRRMTGMPMMLSPDVLSVVPEIMAPYRASCNGLLNNRNASPTVIQNTMLIPPTVRALRGPLWRRGTVHCPCAVRHDRAVASGNQKDPDLTSAWILGWGCGPMFPSPKV